MMNKTLADYYDNTIDGLELLSKLPYRYEPYSSRYWGSAMHNLCSYPSKIKPSIAYFLIQSFSKPTESILDPFSGVGTIPFEACLNGRKGIGIDLSPLAYHVTNSKVHNINIQKVRSEINNLEEIINETNNIDLIDCEAKAFYHPDTYREVLIAKNYFINKTITPERSFVLSCILHILHGNRPYALSRRSHNLIPIPPKGDFVYKSLIKSLTEKSKKMLNEHVPPGFIEGEAYQSDACDMINIESDSIDKIITSPPFLGSTEFLRQNRIRLWFCGWDNNKLNDMKKGSHFLEYNKFKLYPNIFKEFGRVLKDNGLVVLHLGVYKKIDMASSLLPIAEEYGFKKMGLINEDTTHLESHGRTDRGGTHTHQFLILRKFR